MADTYVPVRTRGGGWLTTALCALGLALLWLSAYLFLWPTPPPPEPPTAWPWPYVERTVDGHVTTPMPEDLDR